MTQLRAGRPPHVEFSGLRIGGDGLSGHPGLAAPRGASRVSLGFPSCGRSKQRAFETLDCAIPSIKVSAGGVGLGVRRWFIGVCGFCVDGERQDNLRV